MVNYEEYLKTKSKVLKSFISEEKRPTIIKVYLRI